MNLKSYKFLFFDLDHTLWDYDTNAEETLIEAFELFQLGKSGLDPQRLVQDFLESNAFYWKLFNENKISKEELRIGRFNRILDDKCEKDQLENISHYFTTQCPLKRNLHTDAIFVLETLTQRGYHLYVLTNGFEHAQKKKIESSGIQHFFKGVFTSEGIGHRKPEIEFFQYALNRAYARAENTMMIGDNPETDIAGARTAGIDTAWFAPNVAQNNCEADYHIKSLKDLIEIL